MLQERQSPEREKGRWRIEKENKKLYKIVFKESWCNMKESFFAII